MSFSSDIKTETAKTAVPDRQCACAMMYAVFGSIGVLGLSSEGMNIKITFENLPAAKSVTEILESFFGEKCGIAVTYGNLNSRKSFQLTVSGRENVTQLLSETGFENGSLFAASSVPEEYITDSRLRDMFIRGLFLACGTVVHPKKNYQAEFVLANEAFAGKCEQILNFSGLGAKTVSRNTDYVIYLKSGDSISALLTVLGAYSALLEFENIRAFREMRNNVNRAANCETANFTKTYGSAQQYLKIIDIIDNELGIDSLTPALKEAALLRRENPEASLSELADIGGISKSALNHRLRKLKKIAEGLEEAL